MKCPGEALPCRAPHCPTSSQAAPEHVVSRRSRMRGARGERRAPGPGDACGGGAPLRVTSGPGSSPAGDTP